MPTKLHWTQRPENKKRLSAIRIKSAAKKRAAKKSSKLSVKSTTTIPSNANEIPQDTFAYALGHIEAWLEHYAASAGISASALALKLGEVLRRKSVR